MVKICSTAGDWGKVDDDLANVSICWVRVIYVIIGIGRYQCPHDEPSEVLGDYQT